MRRQPITKADLLARMPRAFRPRLHRDQQRDLACIHIAQLDAIARGVATEANLWEWVGCVLTWCKSAELIDAHVDEMVLQLDLAMRLVERWRATGRVLFSGPDYQLARVGVDLMDYLAASVDITNGKAAATWGDAMLQRLKAGAPATAEALQRVAEPA